jgi:hypothetical protein
VVSLLGQQSIVFKIFKPIQEVSPAEVLEAVQSALAGDTGAQHLVDQAQQQSTPAAQQPSPQQQ